MVKTPTYSRSAKQRSSGIADDVMYLEANYPPQGIVGLSDQLEELQLLGAPEAIPVGRAHAAVLHVGNPIRGLCLAVGLSSFFWMGVFVLFARML